MIGSLAAAHRGVVDAGGRRTRGGRHARLALSSLRLYRPRRLLGNERVGDLVELAPPPPLKLCEDLQPMIRGDESEEFGDDDGDVDFMMMMMMMMMRIMMFL